MSDRGRGGFRGRGGGGGGGPPRKKFQKAHPEDPRVNSTVQIFVEGLPLNAKIPDLVKYFSSVGPVKNDRLTRKPRIWLYHDKITNQPTGECTITYKDSQTQLLALQTFDGQYYEGQGPLRVTPSIVKAHMAKPPPLPPLPPGGRGGRGGRGGGPPRGRGGPPGGPRGRGGPRGGFQGGRGGFQGGHGGFHGGRGGGFQGGFGGQGNNANYEQLGHPRAGFGGGGPVRGGGGPNRGGGFQHQGGFGGNRYQPY